MRQRLTLTIEEATSIFCKGMGEHATELLGAQWWIAGRAEIENVVNSNTLIEASKVVSSWCIDWTARNDSPVRAARRLMRAAFRNV